MATLQARRPPHPDITTIPTPPRQAAGLFIIVFFPCIALIVYGLRVFSRLRTRQWGLDDWLITAAVAFLLALTATFYMYFKLFYFGYHMYELPADWSQDAAMFYFYFAQMLYNPILACVKASMLVFLLRLGGQKPGVRLITHALNLVNALQAIATFLVSVFSCLPVAGFWDSAIKADPNTKCVDNSFSVITAGLTVLTDILVLALPLWIFLGLKMPTKQKIAVIGIFMVGLT